LLRLGRADRAKNRGRDLSVVRSAGGVRWSAGVPAGWLGARPAAEPPNPSTFADNRNTCSSLPFGGEDAAEPAGGDAKRSGHII